MDVSVKTQRFCMTDLYDEYLYLIFERLDAKLDRESFGLTCHRFLDIQNSSRKRLDLTHIYSFDLDKLLKRFTQLESLSLNGCIYVSESDLSRLKNCGSKLHTLYLDDFCNLTSKGLFYIASGCPLLSVISLSKCEISDSGLEILTKSCKYLKEVDLAGCDKITDSGIWSLNQNCRQLRALNISRCRKILGVSLQGCSPTLASLKANNCGLSIEGVTGILSGGGLEYLSFASVECIEGNGLAATGLGFAANLKFLDCHMCDFVTDDVILSISKGFPLLQEWDLSYCGYYISPSGYEPIGLYCKNLEKVHLNGCYSFHDDALLALGNGCPRLSVIRMKKCPQVSPTGKYNLKKQREDVEIIEKEAWTIVPRWAFTKWP